MGKIKVLNNLTKDKLLEMVKYEAQLRYSDEYQQKYQEKIQNNSTDIVENYIQEDVLVKFGYDITDDNLYTLRSAFSEYKDDEDIKNSAFWIGLNIVHDGVDVGTPMKNIILHNIDGEQVELDAIVDKPTIILAGSMT